MPYTVGIKNALHENCSKFEVEVSKQELLLKWNSLTNPIAAIDSHITSLLQSTPTLLDFSKWGQYLPLKFQVNLIKEKYYDIANTEHFLALVKPIENK